MSDKLIRDIHRCSKHHVGAGYHVRVDGETHRLSTSAEMLKLMARTVGGRIRYRVSGFSGGTHCKMAAVITTRT